MFIQTKVRIINNDMLSRRGPFLIQIRTRIINMDMLSRCVSTLCYDNPAKNKDY